MAQGVCQEWGGTFFGDLGKGSDDEGSPDEETAPACPNCLFIADKDVYNLVRVN